MTTSKTGWRKSTHSSAANECIEVARTLDKIRDSKNPAGPILTIDLAALLTDIKAGRFTD